MRVLVTAASKYGATAGIAEAIGRTLEDDSLVVDIVAIEDVAELSGYDALVLGSGVYMGRWLKSARGFVDGHADEIASKPTWLFSSGPIGDPPKPDAESAVDLADVIAAVRPIGHRLFAGKLDRSRLGFGDRAVVTAFRAADGDFRDWDEIGAWAKEVAEELRERHGRLAST